MRQNSSEELLRNIIDSSMDMIQVFKAVRNKAGEIVDFIWILNNKAAENKFGEVIGKSILTVNPGVVEEGIFQDFKNVVDTGAPNQRIIHYVHEQFDGWFHQSIVKQADGVLTTTRDISEYKQTEQEMQQSRQLLQSVIDAPNIGIIVYKAVRNEQGKIIDFVHEFVNRASIEMLSGENFTGKLFTDHGENGILQLPQLIAVIETGQGNAYIREAALSGRYCWFAITNSPLDKDRLVHTWEDITPLKSAELELVSAKEELAQRAEDKYQVIFNSINEGFSLLDIQFDDNGCVYDIIVVDANPAQDKIDGMRTMIGKRVRKVLPNIEMTRFERYGKIARTGISENFEDWSDANQRWYQVSATRVGGEGSTLVAIVYDDITERKRAEDLAAADLQDMQILQELSARLVSEENIQTIYDKVMAAAIRITRADAGTVQIFDAAAQELLLLATSGFPKHVTDYYYRVNAASSTSCGISLRAGERAFIDFDPGSDDIDNQLHVESGYLAAQSTPLIARSGEHIGMVSTHWRDRYHRPTERELRFLDLLGRQAADLIEQRQHQKIIQNSEAKYRTIFETIDEGFTIQELITDENDDVVDIVYLEANAAFEKHTGIKNVVGKKASELVPHLEQHWLDNMKKVYKTGEPLRTEGYQVDMDRWISLQYSRVGGPGSKLLSAIFEDITDTKHREQLQEYRVKLGDTLRLISEPVEIEEKVTGLAMEHFKSDRCYYCTVEGEAAIIHCDAKRGEQLSVSGIYPMASFTLLKKVVDEKQPFVVFDANSTDVLDEPLRQLCFQLDVISFVDVPVVKSGKVVGVLCIVQSTPRNWTTDEVLLIAETAERMWTAMERAKAEEALRQSQLNLSALFAAMPVGVALIDAGGKTIFANKEMHRFLPTGIIPSKDSERAWRWRGFHPDGKPVEVKDYPGQRAMQNLSGGPVEFLYQHDDGTEIWARVNYLPIANYEGNVTRFICVITDINDLKRNAEALQKSEQRLREFGEASQDVLWIRDADTLQWTYLTAGFENIYGLSRTEALSGNNYRNWLDLIVQEDRADSNKYIDRVRAGERVIFEYRICRPKDGAIRWLRNTDFPIVDKNGKVSHIGGIGHDITDVKRTQEHLSWSEERQMFLLNLSDTLRAATGVEAVGNTAVQMIAEKLGVDRVYLVTLTPGDDNIAVTHETRREDLPPLLGSYRGSDFPAALKEIFEHTIVYDDVRTDTRLTELDRMSFTALSAVGFMATCVRIGNETMVWAAGAVTTQPRSWTKTETTLFEDAVERTWAAIERASAEEALKNSEHQLKRLLKLRDEFIGIASHELNTPITSMKVYAEIVQERIADIGDSNDIDLLSKLNKQIDRLSSLVTVLLDTTRIAGGTLVLSLEEIDINEIIHERTEEIGRTSNHKIVLQLQHVPKVFADSERIGQVMLNLLSNAIKYSPQGSIITISTKLEAAGIRVSVQDQGYGIPEEDISKIFERFFRVTANNMDTYPGMGLGLYISAQIIERHGGAIFVESTLNVGSTFSFILPK